MRKIVFFSCAFLLLLHACTTRKPTSMLSTHRHNPVVAHRGAFKKNGFPENSIASLREAIRLGCAGSEFDVHMTADDSLIIHHDPDYHGMAIERSTYAQLAAFPLSNGETLPTLRSYLLAGKTGNTHTRMVLEIKPSRISKERGRKVAEACVALVLQTGAAPITLFISFDYDILKRIRDLQPAARTQYLNGDIAPAQLKADKISGADYHYSVFQKHPEWIQQAKENGIVLNAWTVNDRKTLEWLLQNGFDYITTNEPELLFTLLKNTPEAK